MKQLLPYRLALLLALATAACKKDSAAPPTNTSLLTTPTWHSTDLRLVLNGVEGVYTLAAADARDLNFTSDGKYVSTAASGNQSDKGSWAFASNETQLAITPSSGTPPAPFQLFALTSSTLSLGYNYTQAQVQHALDNNNTAPTATEQDIRSLVLGSSLFKFPNNTPPVSSSQITSMSYRLTYQAK